MLSIDHAGDLGVMLETLLNPATADRALQYIKTPLRS
jgi:hypothetical protein